MNTEQNEQAVLVDYVFGYCTRLLTEAERLAYRSIIAQRKARNARSEGERQALRNLWVSDAPEVRTLLANGESAFLQATAVRVVLENGEGILNRCARCGVLARTPHAKQCPACFHDWHDEEAKE